MNDTERLDDLARRVDQLERAVNPFGQTPCQPAASQMSTRCNACGSVIPHGKNLSCSITFCPYRQTHGFGANQPVFISPAGTPTTPGIMAGPGNTMGPGIGSGIQNASK